MSSAAQTIVIVGGGTAGWVTAAVLAAERAFVAGEPLRVVLVESPDVPIIGVGEGTWPSMRQTLQRVGLAEHRMFAEAQATFKQGTRFVGWRSGGTETYDHPFSLPQQYASTNLAAHWLSAGRPESFSAFVTPQAATVEHGLAPKQAGMPDYAFAVNYAYHLDAGRFAQVLQTHAVEQLGVHHVRANVTTVIASDDGDISGLRLDSGELLEGFLFVDCTGQRALLLGEHYGVPMQPLDHVLFNDRAVAAQVPHESACAPIASATVATAHDSGWIWDIALQERRGIGLVFSSRHLDAAQAKQRLLEYVRSDAALRSDDLNEDALRVLSFEPGHRQTFWHRNCVAVGLSAGFVEPLEASAIALVEQSARLIAQHLPQNRSIMSVVAQRFNEKMGYHWKRIVEFLKLHYVLSSRTEPYWQDHRDPSTWPAELADKLTLWQQQPPYHFDAPMLDELFPSASYQYVLYGMGFAPEYAPKVEPNQQARDALREVRTMRERLLSGLQPNRELLNQMVSS